MENKVVHGMWIGKQLSKIELLTMTSFIDKGHTFKLWAYDDIETPVPPEVVVEDATTIIPRKDVFSYKNYNKFGHGKGSYAGFSDIFRYKLLYEHGGWWVDMDITCLKPFDFEAPYVFRKHHDLMMVGNVMKCPKGAEIMLDCYHEAMSQVTEDNRDWHKPIAILNNNVLKHGLAQFILDDMSYPDIWIEIRVFIKKNRPMKAHYYFIHWMNEEWRARGLNKNRIKRKSSLGFLMKHYGLVLERYSLKYRIINFYKNSDFYSNLKLLKIIDNA
ncbi:MAG: hypothetical protein GY751_10675 [Bacteroidetes bacterium]|nr:hypothetical protein [Bacteroidota bacterium]